MQLYKQLFREDTDQDDRGFTTLHRIILGLDDTDVRTYLQLCSPAEIDQRDSRGYSALHWAAQRGDHEIVRRLLTSKSDPNLRSGLGRTPLHGAAKDSKLFNLKLLLDRGAEINARDSHGITPLNLLAFSSIAADPACAQTLIKFGADVNAQCNAGTVPLYFASRNGHVPILTLLLENDADPNIPDSEGETALTVAIQANQYDVLPALLAHGANPAHHTRSGRSILHEAAQWGDQKTLRLLTSLCIRGIQVEHRSSDGQTARDLARSRPDITEEWQVAFADLIASIDETVDERSLVLPQTNPWLSFQLSRVPQVRLSGVIRVIEDGTFNFMVWLYRIVLRLLQMQVSVPSSVFVVLAILWYILTQ